MAVAVGAATAAAATSAVEGVFRVFEPKRSDAIRWIAVTDRRSGWRLRPGYNGPGPDLPDIEHLTYSVRINREGFRGAETPRAKPPGVVRIVAVGDSVTFGFGVEEAETYPSLVAAALSSDTRRVDAINAGVPGYTSLQGLRALDRALALHPDIVTILYGWNDGWLTIEPYAARTSLARQLVESSAALTAFEEWRTGGRVAATAPTFRFVPPHHFETNLIEIATRVRRAGAVPVLLTAPAAFGPGIPGDRYFRRRWVGPRELLEPTHHLYADAVREAAETHAIPLIDSARLVPSDPALFLADGYHPNRRGHEALAELIVRGLRCDGRFVATQPATRR